MKISINPSDILEDKNRKKSILSLSVVKTSRIPDQKNIFKHEEREKAIKKRYGKDVRILITYDSYPNNQLKEITQRYESRSGIHYSITEYFNDIGESFKSILCCFRNNKNYEYSFNRFLDAEISMIDMIADEEVG